MNRLEITKQNEEKILNSFYSELKEQGFSFSVYDGELFNEAPLVDDILNLYHNLDVMHIHVQKGDYKGCVIYFRKWRGWDLLYV